MSTILSSGVNVSGPPVSSQPVSSPDKQIQPKKDIVPRGIRYSFTLTYILLMTTATITFIEAMRTKNPVVRHVLNLETCISVVAGYFYSIFVGKLNDYEATNTEINWKELTFARYVDWSITTPMMLLALCIVLSNEIGISIHFPVMLAIIVLNYLMLYIGYLGESEVLGRSIASFLGFVPFLSMFGLIFWKYVMPKYSIANRALFSIYFVVWSMYGLVYLLDNANKNIAMNLLDLTAKCVIGLGLWVYYVRVIRL